VSPEREFQLIALAVDEYPGELASLPASDSAGELERLLGDWGLGTVRRPDDTRAQGLRDALARWTGERDGAACSLVYWAGHGWDDGNHAWLYTSQTVPPANPSNAIQAAELATYLIADAARRAGSDDPQSSWTLVVLDCCGSPVAVSNIANVLTQTPARRPPRCVLFPVAEAGGAFAGRFVTKLREALDALTANDHEIMLRDLLGEIADGLGGDIQPEGALLPGRIALVNVRAGGAVITGNLDAIEELKTVVAELPEEVESHFFAKALGGESGELAWYFSGRGAELSQLVRWLGDAPSGVFAVTGAPGSGKSAILGHLVTLADQQLLQALQAAGLLEDVPADMLPPPGVFDATLRLTGMTEADCRRTIAKTLDADAAPSSLQELVAGRAAATERCTLLADALDEASEPQPIARLLRSLAALPGVRVVVGTRASAADHLDVPVSGKEELLDTLGAAATIVVTRDPTAVEEYVRRRLRAPRSPYRLQPAAIDELAAPDSGARTAVPPRSSRDRRAARSSGVRAG
jgi:hypothetical protein